MSSPAPKRPRTARKPGRPTPGPPAPPRDWLAEHAQKAGLDDAALWSLRSWLAEQLVADELAKLGQGGHTENRVPLRRVFVDLPITQRLLSEPEEVPDDAFFLRSLRGRSPFPLAALRDSAELEEMESLEDVVSEPAEPRPDVGRRVTVQGPGVRSPQSELSGPGSRGGMSIEPVCAGILLIGGPGQGKSTLGQLACQFHRVALLEPCAAQLPTSVRDVLSPFISTNDEEDLSLPEAPLLPLRVVLPDAAGWLARQGEEERKGALPALFQFLAGQPSARKAKLAGETLVAIASTMPFLLLLDGFDEVGAVEDRERIVAAARELFTELGRHDARAVVVATTRPQGYSGELSRIGVPLRRQYLAPLGPEEAIAYATKLVEAKIQGVDDQKKILERLHAASTEAATARLLQTPLQVTILTALVQQQGRAPSERWKLFGSYFDFTYRREIERDTYASSLLATRQGQIEAIHARVALLLQVEAEIAGGAAARMSRERLQGIVDAVLQEDEVGDEERADLVQRIVDAAEKRLVFLVEPEPGSFGFEIRSLQEFMAAWALSEGRDSAIESRLLQVAKAPMFRNVVLFLASKLYSERSALRDVLADRVCGALDEDPADPLARAVRAGASLALEVLEEGSAVSQPKRARSLMERAAGLLDLPPGPEHARLAGVANDDTAPVLRAAIESRLGRGVTKETVDTQAAWLCLIEATNLGQSWAREVGETYWASVSDPAQLLSVCRSGRIPIGGWLISKVDAAPEAFRPESLLALRFDHRVPAELVRSAWARAMVQGYWGRRRILSSREGHDIFVTLLPRQGKTSRYAGLVSMPSPPPQWRAWVAAAAFLQEPSAALLAKTLQIASEGSSDEDWRALGRWMPWPLAACINAAEGSADLRLFASMLLQGELGDAADWYLAEERWGERLSFRSAIEATAGQRPWSMGSLAAAPPLAASVEYVRRGRAKQDVTALLPVAARAFEAGHSKIVAERLADLCLRLFGSLPDSDEADVFPVRTWANVAGAPPDWLVTRPKRLSEGKWLEVVDAFGARRLVRSMFVLQRAPDAYIQHPESLGLLYYAMLGMPSLRAQASRSAVWWKLKGVVSARSYDTTAARAFAAVLRTWLGGLTRAEASDLFEDMSIQAESEPSLWLRFLTAVRDGDLPDDVRDFLVLRCHEQMAARSLLTTAVIDVLRGILQSRRSGLSSPAAWDRLALPMPYPIVPVVAARRTVLPETPVAFRALHVQHLRVLRDLELPFEPPPPDKGQWIVFLGANGVGKTTLLRSLVLALRNLNDPKIWPKGTFATDWHANGGPGEAKIRVDVVDHGEQLTKIRLNGSESFSQFPRQDAPRLFPLFAYGCRRGSALGGAARAVDLSDDDGPEVATLFDEGAPLIHAETWLMQWDGDAQKNERSRVIFEAVRKALCNLLDLDSIEVLNQKVWVSGRGVGRVEMRALSDGYITTAGWFLDLLARWITLAEREPNSLDAAFMERMTGLVLIDELDLHLHPRWQVEVISRTRTLLPRMSFVVTTHNPLTLVGAKPEEIWILSMENGKVQAERGTESPMLLTGGQIYSRYFGIQDIYPNELGRKLRRYSFLSGYALRDDKEQAEMEALREVLQKAGVDPGWEEVPREPLPSVPPEEPPAKQAKKKAQGRAS